MNGKHTPNCSDHLPQFFVHISSLEVTSHSRPLTLYIRNSFQATEPHWLEQSHL
ncbi:hypothetical protein HK096_010462, partial [Nowakowskiella sp. JEL0078]